MYGLRMTRRYRYWTLFVRRASRVLSYLTLDPLEKLAVIAGLIKKPQMTLLWTKQHTWNPVVPQSSSPAQTSNTNTSPFIELTDYSTTTPQMNSRVHDTPAMAHSLFPPAIPTHRLRNESDASLNPALSHTPTRTSDDSSRPLIQRPPETYRGDTEGRASGEGRVSFEDTLSPTSPPDQGGWLGPNTTLHTRQGYRCASSDPGSPPVDVVGGVHRGLGIRLSDEDLERGRLHDEVLK